jgi:hypothetical protein
MMNPCAESLRLFSLFRIFLNRFRGWSFCSIWFCDFWRVNDVRSMALGGGFC